MLMLINVTDKGLANVGRILLDCTVCYEFLQQAHEYEVFFEELTFYHMNNVYLMNNVIYSFHRV